MKRIISKLAIIISFCLALLITFLLNPSLTYANVTNYKNIVIYHNTDLSEDWEEIIDISLETIKKSEIYSTSLKSELCLNDGIYPSVVKRFLGDDVFTAFSNKIIVMGEKSDSFNRFTKWGQTMKSSQFMSHALMHNLQFKYHGILDANPLGKHPDWKWEGYVEYVVLGDLISFDDAISIVLNDELDDFEWVYINEEEGTIKRHIEYLALVKYCLDVLNWNYDELMNTPINQDDLMKQLMAVNTEAS